MEMAELDSRLENLMREGEDLLVEGTIAARPDPPCPISTPRCCFRPGCPTIATRSARGDRTVLVIEDDAAFAGTVLETARERGFRASLRWRGDSGVALAHEYPAPMQ